MSNARAAHSMRAFDAPNACILYVRSTVRACRSHCAHWMCMRACVCAYGPERACTWHVGAQLICAFKQCRASCAYRKMRHQNIFPFWVPDLSACRASLHTVTRVLEFAPRWEFVRVDGFAMARSACVKCAWHRHCLRAAGVLSASIGCASVHRFAHTVQSVRERGMRAHHLNARSGNCTHHGPTAKCGTKACHRFGDTIWARCARSCKLWRALGVCAALEVCARR